MKVVLCGPPHSGKSCLRYGLKEAIRTIRGAPYPYVITACPDGEGGWFQETVCYNDKLAINLKKKYKGTFSVDFTKVAANWVKNSSVDLTLIDIGGIPDDKNEIICAAATHAVILARDDSSLKEWRNFCNKLNLKIVAEIFSDYKGKEDKKLQLEKDGIYRGSVHYLERGDLSVKNRPAIIDLAHILVNFSNQKIKRVNMSTYNVTIENGDTLSVGFGDHPAQNDKIVIEASKHIDELIANRKILKREIIKVNGPASMPVAMMLGYRLSQLFETVACYDPKLSKYVIVVTNNKKYKIGDLID